MEMYGFKPFPETLRGSDGSLPVMTIAQRKTAVKLIRELCSNYDGGNCILLDNVERCPCVQANSFTVLCKMFRRAILEHPRGKILKAEIFRDKNAKHCAVCCEVFYSQSNNAKYCKNCTPAVKLKQSAGYIRIKRQNVGK